MNYARDTIRHDGVRLPRALAPATLASLIVHVAIAFVLAAVVSPRPFAWGYATTALNVELVALLPAVAMHIDAKAKVIPAVLQVPVSSFEPTPSAINPMPAAAAPPSPVVVPPATLYDAPPPSLAIGRIGIAENYAALSGLPEELALRTQGEFLVEVDQLVRVARNPDVIYPPAALKAGREGTVVAWLALNRDGAVEETIIVSGEPEFAEAVEAGLPGASFLPAENGGQTVPFYLILTIEFRAN